MGFPTDPLVRRNRPSSVPEVQSPSDRATDRLDGCPTRGGLGMLEEADKQVQHSGLLGLFQPGLQRTPERRDDLSAHVQVGVVEQVGEQHQHSRLLGLVQPT